MSAALSGIAASNLFMRLISTMDDSSMTTRSVSRGLSLPLLEAECLGVEFQHPVNGFRLDPCDSVRRFAARPVGAHRVTSICFALMVRSMLLTRVVLPTPGPPVITTILRGRGQFDGIPL